MTHLEMELANRPSRTIRRRPLRDLPIRTVDLPALVPTPPPAVDPGAIDRFVEIVRRRDEQAVERFVQDLLDAGVSSESVFLDWLAPVAARLGELWEEDRCDFVEVTMALGRLQRVLRNLSQMLLPADPTKPMLGRALLTCVPGEQHTLGLFMVAEMFVREGFDVSVGSPVSEIDLLHSIASDWFDLVGFSLSCDTQLKTVRRAIADVRRLSKNPAVRVLVGGAIVRRHPALAGAVGADRWAPDARVAAQVARTLAPKP